MSEIIELNDENFEQQLTESEKPVLVDYWAEWCGPCKMVAPILEELSDELKDKLTIAKLDVDNNRDSAIKQKVMSIPTLILFKDGNPIDQRIGALTKNQLLELNNEIRNIVNFVTLIDIITNKAFITKKYNYCKPVIKNKCKKAFVNVDDLRHPLVEHIQTNEVFTANDISLGKKTDGMLLYGTNTSGKSTLIKSIGIAVVMAQAGMFVPALLIKISILFCLSIIDLI